MRTPPASFRIPARLVKADPATLGVAEPAAALAAYAARHHAQEPEP